MNAFPDRGEAPSTGSGQAPLTITEESLKRYIRDVPDFPQPGVLFRDITPLLQDSQAFQWVVDRMSDEFRGAGLNAVVGIESRGFLLAAPLAYKLGLPLVPVRKAGKLPSARMSVEYALEYGAGQLDIHEDALRRDDRVVIVDDLLATGGTAMATAKLVELLGARVHSFAFLVELAQLGGRERLRDYPAFALIRYE
ncbi:MAG: adenine phosphoribosyltransferase [Chloroflexi bacterium]|nr:adenine phosphoribosyltransferase [Chloroflexota bacterium]